MLVTPLHRFYDPTQGRVPRGGVDLRELPVDALRRRIGAAFQDFVRFELSAAENIGVGVGDVEGMEDRGRIAEAAKRAGIAPALDTLPLGHDTVLTRARMTADTGDDPVTGVVLPGGQWQRLARARVVFRRESALGRSPPVSIDDSSGPGR